MFSFLFCLFFFFSTFFVFLSLFFFSFFLFSLCFSFLLFVYFFHLLCPPSVCLVCLSLALYLCISVFMLHIYPPVLPSILPSVRPSIRRFFAATPPLDRRVLPGRSWEEFRNHFSIGAKMVVPRRFQKDVERRPQGEKLMQPKLRGEALPSQVS